MTQTHIEYWRDAIKQLVCVPGILSLGLCAGCGPGAESELQALAAECLPSPSVSKSEGGLDGKTLADLLEACNQRLSALNTANTAKEH